ncbi:MAG: DUF2786 domain-containing protein [Microthrixaceae bacterium]|nr:DUF2786 domain-containing protein [Microthrixaceae bacterium]
MTATLLAAALGVVLLAAHLRRDPADLPRRHRRAAPPPTPPADGDAPLRLVQQRQARREQAQQRVDEFRADRDEADRRLRAWAGEVARSRRAEWYGYEATTGLIEVELGREAIAVAHEQLRHGASVDQAVHHAISVVEELTVDVVARVGLIIDEWTPAPVPEDATRADRRRRIERLRAKAASTTFPEEAASFSAKADQLAARYGIPA